MNTFERDVTVLGVDLEKPGFCRPTGDIEATKQEVLEDLAQQRAEMLALPSDESGLDVAGVQNFFGEAGLRVPDHIVLSRETMPRFQELLNSMVAVQEPIDGRGGMYHEILDIAVVYRNHDLEHRNGRVFTEGVLAHEYAHGSSEHRRLTIVQAPDWKHPVSWQARVGFITAQLGCGRRGEFFEEAYAEGKAAEYRRATGLYSGRARKFGLSMPDQYIHHEGSKPGYYISPEAFAATAFDMLAELRPGLKPRMTAARQSIAGIVKFARILNRLEPGLYNELRNIPFGERQFSQGFLKAVEVYKRYAPRVPVKHPGS